MNKQKELSNLLYTVYCSDAADGGNEFDEMAQAIIAKYPQILAEKVWAGDLFDFENNSEIKLPERFEIFIREVK